MSADESHPEWGPFAKNVDEMERTNQPPEPVVHGYEDLPPPASGNSMTNAIILTSLILAGLVLGTRMRSSS